MKKLITQLLVSGCCAFALSLTTYHAQAQVPCLGGPNYDVPVYTLGQITVLQNLHYSNAPANPYQKLDAYVPPTQPPAACNNPVPIVLLIPGNWWVDGYSDKTDPEFVAAAYGLARRGYIVAAMNYRPQFCNGYECYTQSCPSPRSCHPESYCELLESRNGLNGLRDVDQAWYRAYQDGVAAVKFVMGRAQADLNITVGKVFVLGVRSGATLAQSLAYLDPGTDLNAYDPNLVATLGDENAKVKSQFVGQELLIHGVVAISGALPYRPILKTLPGEPSPPAPLYLFHGTCDKIAPFCNTTCEEPASKWYGAWGIKEYIDNEPTSGICYRVNVYNEKGHDLSNYYAAMFPQIIDFYTEIHNTPPGPSCHQVIPCAGDPEPEPCSVNPDPCYCK